MTTSATPRVTDKTRCTIFTDGGARGNPGPAAAGGVILSHDGKILAEVHEFLGVATNNVAEYRALILALERALEMGCRRADVRLDSELVVRQLNGLYRVRDEKMIPLFDKVRKLLAQFEDLTIAHVRREANKHADKLVNAVLDAHAASMAEKKQL